MKFTLTITDASPSDLSKLLDLLAGSTASAGVTYSGAAQSTQHTLPPAPDAEDDESGDTAAPVVAGSVDSTGLPWDDRIHSTPAKLTSKNVWRRRKGVADALVASVEAELRARSAPPAAQQPAPAPQQQYQPVPQTYQPPTGQPPAQPMQPQQFTPPQPGPQFQQPQQFTPPQPGPQYQPPALAPQPQQMQPTGPLDFGGFMTRIQQIMNDKMPDGSNMITPDYLAYVAGRIGQQFGTNVTAITDIAGNQPMIDFAIQVMTGEGRWK